MPRLATTSVLLSILAGAAWSQPEDLNILTSGWPGAVFFRQCEGTLRHSDITYGEWEAAFSRLDGIIGKALDEEIPGTMERCPEAYRRFKAAHPDQLALLHFNGNSRDPRFDAGELFAGHWIYYNGCGVTRDVPAEADETVIAVEDTDLFRVNMGRFQDKNEDLAICRLGPGGRPDWSVSEQLQLIAIDHAASTLTVRRGAFGTEPQSFPAGESYIAAHACEGPWGRNANLLWYYNYSLTCPTDAQGRQCADVLVEDIAQRFEPGGVLDGLDGLEFDVLHYDFLGPWGIGSRALDVDADGQPDQGWLDGRNVYGLGVTEFTRQLRERVGPDLLLLADGHSDRHQRSFGILNGIESEGWPTLSDPLLREWSGGLNRHLYWRDHAHAPAFSYINHKFNDASGQIDTPPNIDRLVMAASLFTDSVFTYSQTPPRAGQVIGIYDELRLGTEDQLHWLGSPLGESRHLTLDSPNLLDDWDPAHFRPGSSGAVHFEMGSIPVAGRDVVLSATARCTVTDGGPGERSLRVSARPAGDLMRADIADAAVMQLEDGQDQPLDRATGASLHYMLNAEIEGDARVGY
ncbi:MAG: hypothetical protein GF320_06920, partial [Armatimonadia bacterium]|nr:hypothetical protein [Armatimonadia bacterium]